MPVTALEAVTGDWSRDLGGDRSSGRLPRPVHGLSSSPSSHTGIVSDIPGRLSSGSSLAARGRGDACQRSLRNRPRSGSRLLQSPLPGGEGDWRLEACDRSLTLERLRPADVVQDGNSCFDAVICQRGGFSNFLGSEGYVLSDPDPRIIEEAVEVHVGGDSLPVQSPVLRSVDCSPGLYRRCQLGHTLAGSDCSVTWTIGWFSLPSEKKAKESIRELPSLCCTLGIVINEKKSDLVPSQSAKYLGMTIDTGAGKVFPSLARVEKFLTVAERFCSMQSPPAQLWQVILGHLASLERLVPHGRLRMRSLQWHLKMHWSPESDPPSLPVALPEEARRDLSWWMVKDHLLMGVRFWAPAPDLHLYSDASSSGWGAHLLDQNVSGVWSAQEKLLHINLLEMKAIFLGLQAFQKDVAGHHVTAMCDNSTVVAYVNKRGHGVQVPVFVDQPPFEMDGEFRRPSRCEVSTRRVQRPGRCSQLSRASCRDRVVSPPSGGESTSLCVGQSVNRPVCDLPQREAAPVLLACPGSPGRLRGCVSSSLGRPGSVRFPSLCSGLSGDRPRPAVVACRDDSGRASLAREGVVRRLAASTDPTTPGSALLGQAALATPLQSVPSRRPLAEPSRVATLKRHYRKSGFSGRAARVLSGVLRESSSRLYQSRWRIFCGWCRGRGVAPVNATVPVVVDFLIHLRQDKGFSVSAVKGYCSPLNSVLALKGRDLAASREITTLLRSFARSVNPVELRPPAWDVSLVL